MLNPKVCLFGKISTNLRFNVFIFVELFFTQDTSALMSDQGDCDAGQVYVGICWHVLSAYLCPDCSRCLLCTWHPVPCTAQRGGHCSFVPFAHGAPRWWSCYLDPGNFCSKVHAHIKIWLHVLFKKNPKTLL